MSIASDEVYIPLDVKNHIDLLAERGMDVGELRQRFQDTSGRIAEDDRADAPEWRELERDVLAADEAWRLEEPNDLEGILQSRPGNRVDAYETVPGSEVLRDKVCGGWYGRVAGCILGKPVECLMKESDSRAKLRELLVESDEWPMEDYVSERTIGPYWEKGGRASWFRGGNPSLREYMEFAPSDDDLNYTALSLKLVKHGGRDFTPDAVLDAWLRNLSFFSVCTAEKIAYRNRVMGLSYPRTAQFRNTYREWIGAQIRTDLYGYISPGRPEEAARMAWNDAAASHTENGIYGAMWVSAAIAAAFCETDARAIVLRGLEQIPAGSRFAEHMRKTVEVAEASGDDFEATFDDIAARLGHYHCVHAIPNACIVAAGLIHARGDFGKAICIAVMGGLDTDCNGATAGSIAGVLIGRKALPKRWTAPLNDTLHTSVSGYARVKISEMANETVGLIQA
jgi:ADP-ribosylglycohydrolase